MKGIIFDMDGVLIDSEPQQIESTIKVLDMFGIKTKADDFIKFMGMYNLQVMALFKQTYNLEVSPERMFEIQTNFMIKEVENNFHLMPKFNEMAKELETLKNVKFAIASSSPRALVNAVIKKLGWEDFLSSSVTGDEVTTSKPSPEIYQKAARVLNLDVKDCLVLEDSSNGMQSALDAGMAVVGFFPPNSENKDFSKVRYKISSLNEFPFSVNKFVNGEKMSSS